MHGTCKIFSNIRFSSVKALKHSHQIVESSRLHVVYDLVAWLLQNDLVVEVYTYYYILIPELVTEDKSDWSAYIEKVRTHLQNNYNDGSAEYKLLYKYCYYFNGKFPFEDIAFSKRMKEDAVDRFQKKYVVSTPLLIRVQR